MNGNSIFLPIPPNGDSAHKVNRSGIPAVIKVVKESGMSRQIHSFLFWIN